MPQSRCRHVVRLTVACGAAFSLLTGPTTSNAAMSLPPMKGAPQAMVDAGLVGNYRAIKDANAEEWGKLCKGFEAAATPQKMAQSAINQLRALEGCFIGNHVDMLEHNLQTATRALRDGCHEDTVIAALFHDLGEVMTPVNHGEVAGALLRPYISPENYWVLIHHEIFQAYYYQDIGGLKEKNTRERFKTHPYYQACVDFCEKYDQPSFDPDYDTLPLSYFEPMVHRLFKRMPYSHPDHGKDPLNAAKMTIIDGYPTEGRES
eukprot:TRINITY_DN48769_c0_g2_i3.p2 TRINITY_DN48769_c0_g2~~TRINITY_DN48769_c0_g2_i3.p2  ORF type:complete len:262 (+),score=50.97 TRINITY_DN48769_c0_g2_i3:77-862(+)